MAIADSVDNRSVYEKLVPESLTGAQHPLARPTSDAPPVASSTAVEVVTGADGKTQEKPVGKLDAGDHTIQLQDGRQFLVHVPKTSNETPLPVMFMFTGSGEPQWNIKDFAPESGMSKVADEDPNHPFVVVYALPKKHFLGTGSNQEAFGWNTKGVLIDDADRRAAGYDDLDYVKSIVNLVPQLANVRSDHADWGAVGWSQGGVMLNSVISEIPHLFPSVGLVGSSMDENYKYDIKPGNAQNVSIEELHGDKTTFPMGGFFNGSFAYHAENIGRFLLKDINIFGYNGKNRIERKDPLAAIHNEDEVPQLQNKLYLSRLGTEGQDYSVTKISLPTPTEDTKKDWKISYKPNRPDDDRRVTVFGLEKAQHSYPVPLYGPRTNATEKYTEFDSSREFATIFDDYNDRIHSKVPPADDPNR